VLIPRTLGGGARKACARFDQIRASGALPLTQLAPLHFGLAPTADIDQLFRELPADATTGGLTSRTARKRRSESGRPPARALDFALRGIAQFEAAVARLSRDSDSVSQLPIDIGSRESGGTTAGACVLALPMLLNCGISRISASPRRDGRSNR